MRALAACRARLGRAEREVATAELAVTDIIVHTMRAIARVGILTGGGDCPGLNAVIRGVVRKAVKVHGDEAAGFRYGWAGVVQGDAVQLDLHNTSGDPPARGDHLGYLAHQSVFDGRRRG